MISWQIKEGDLSRGQSGPLLEQLINPHSNLLLFISSYIPDHNTPTLTAPGPGSRQLGIAVPAPQSLKISN